jgi:hypothetical protein
MASVARITIGVCVLGLTFSLGRLFVSAEWMTAQMTYAVSHPIVLYVAAVLTLLYARRLLIRLSAPDV